MSTAIKLAREKLKSLIDVDATTVAGTRTDPRKWDSSIDDSMYTQWCMSCITIIKNLAPNSHYEREFNVRTRHYASIHDLDHQLGVLKALLADLDGGHLRSLRGLIRAEVFGDFIDQAQHLLDEGYWQSAAVVAGSVLEDHLRKLCQKHPSIVLPAKPKLDTMNAELTKAGEYDGLAQKRITYLADIRNKAAHGQWDKFTPEDTKELIQSVTRFLADHPL